jgi:hypothetical protein
MTRPSATPGVSGHLGEVVRMGRCPSRGARALLCGSERIAGGPFGWSVFARMGSDCLGPTRVAFPAFRDMVNAAGRVAHRRHASHRARTMHGVMHAQPERRSQSWSQVAPRHAVLEPVSDRHAWSTHVNVRLPSNHAAPSAPDVGCIRCREGSRGTSTTAKPKGSRPIFQTRGTSDGERDSSVNRNDLARLKTIWGA